MRGLRFGLVAVALLVGAAPALAEKRVALVIGNGAYRNTATLANPEHDASDTADALNRLGFAVTRHANLGFDQMRRTVIAFGREARDADLAVIFFAGHGMEIGGENWLIPVDAELLSDRDAETEAISLRSAMLQVASARRLGLVILDACRNNPFAARMQRSSRVRAVERGLARSEPADNVLVAYAARDGTTAQDGSGRNSPFTAALLKNIEMPGLEITFLFRNVRDDVMAATRREQQPFVYGSLSREQIFLKGAAPAGPTPDVALWNAIKDSKAVGLFEEFIRIYPASPRVAEARARLEQLKTSTTASANPLEPVRRPAEPPAAGNGAVNVAVGTGSPTQSPPPGQVLMLEVPARGPVLFSPDGRRLVTPRDKKLAIFEVATGALRGEISGHRSAIRALALSPDGTRVVSGSSDEDATLRIWDSASGQQLRALSTAPHAVWDVAFAGSGRFVVAIVSKGPGTVMPMRVGLWNAESGAFVRDLFVSTDELVDSMAASADGQRVAIRLSDGHLRLLDLSGKVLWYTKLPQPGASIPIRNGPSLAFSPNGQRLVSGGRDGIIRLLDAQTGATVWETANQGDAFVAFSPDGERIVSGSGSSVRLWNGRSGELIVTFPGHGRPVGFVAYSPDGRLIVSHGGDGTVRIWDATWRERSGGEASRR